MTNGYKKMFISLSCNTCNNAGHIASWLYWYCQWHLPREIKPAYALGKKTAVIPFFERHQFRNAWVLYGLFRCYYASYFRWWNWILLSNGFFVRTLSATPGRCTNPYLVRMTSSRPFISSALDFMIVIAALTTRSFMQWLLIMLLLSFFSG